MMFGHILTNLTDSQLVQSKFYQPIFEILSSGGFFSGLVALMFMAVPFLPLLFFMDKLQKQKKRDDEKYKIRKSTA